MAARAASSFWRAVADAWLAAAIMVVSSPTCLAPPHTGPEESTMGVPMSRLPCSLAIEGKLTGFGALRSGMWCGIVGRPKRLMISSGEFGEPQPRA